MHRVLCQLKALVATTEVMPWKGNGALLFPLSTLKHKWLRWTISPRKPGSWRSKPVWRPPGISLGTRHVLWRDERLWKKAQKDCSSHSHPELRENMSSSLEELLLFSLWCFLIQHFQHSVPHSDILYAWIHSNVVVDLWNLGVSVLCLFIFCIFTVTTFSNEPFGHQYWQF